MGRRERRQEKQRKRNLVMSIFFIFLMVFGFGLASIVVYNPTGGTPDDVNPITQTQSYNGIKFENQDGYLVAELQGRVRRFNYPPATVQSINVPEEALGALSTADVIGITFNPKSPNVGMAELAKFQMQNNLDKTIYSGITQNSTQYTFPIVTCEDATPEAPVVMLTDANRTSVRYEGGCVVVSGSSVDLVRAAERIMYEMFGVI